MIRLPNIFSRFFEQSRVLLRTMVVLVLLLFLFSVTIGGISHHNKWKIIRIDVAGVNAVSEDAVRALVLEKILGNYFLVYARDNSYLFPAGDIAQSLMAAFPRIQTVSVRRNDEHSISVHITERKPYALWCGKAFSLVRNDCWFMDNAGYIFDRAPLFSEGVYFEIYADLSEAENKEILRLSVPATFFNRTSTLVKLLRAGVGEPLRVVSQKENGLEITMNDSEKYPVLAGVTLRFGDDTPPETLIKNLLTALPAQFPDGVSPKKKLVYIDMRFGNKIFFGFEN